jgi:hypothetical protein
MQEQIEGTATGPELEPYKVELNRGMKGQYGWTITVRGKDKDHVQDDLFDVDQHLRKLYLIPDAAKGE